MTSASQPDPPADIDLSRLLAGLDAAAREIERVEQRITAADTARREAEERSASLTTELDTQRTEFAQALQAERDDASSRSEAERAEFTEALEAERAAAGRSADEAAQREQRLTDRVASLEGSLADATGERDARSADLEATRDQLIEEAQLRIAGDEQVTSLTERLTDLQQSLEASDRRVADIETRVREANEKHAGERSRADDTLRSVRDELTALQQQAGEREAEHERLLREKQDDLDAAAQKARFETDRADTAEKRADDAERRADTAEPYSREMERALATAEEKHRGAVTEHKSALSTARRDAQSAQTAAQRTIDELNEQLAAAEQRATAATTERDAAVASRETFARRLRDGERAGSLPAGISSGDTDRPGKLVSKIDIDTSLDLSDD